MQNPLRDKVFTMWYKHYYCVTHHAITPSHCPERTVATVVWHIPIRDCIKSWERWYFRHLPWHITDGVTTSTVTTYASAWHHFLRDESVLVVLYWHLLFLFVLQNELAHLDRYCHTPGRRSILMPASNDTRREWQIMHCHAIHETDFRR